MVTEKINQVPSRKTSIQKGYEKIPQELDRKEKTPVCSQLKENQKRLIVGYMDGNFTGNEVIYILVLALGYLKGMSSLDWLEAGETNKRAVESLDSTYGQ